MRRRRPRHDPRAGVRLGHHEAFRQLGHGPAGRISPRASRRLQACSQDMNPLMGVALAHTKPSPLHDLERIGLQGDPDTQQPLLGRRQWAGLVGGVPTGGARLSVEPPCRHMGLEGGLNGGDQRPKLLQRETGPLEHLSRTGLELSALSRAHGGGLLSLEAQDIINRDELF